MNRSFVVVGFSLLALAGAFFPLATAGSLYVNVGHVGGMAYLLYVLPLVALVLSVVSVYRAETPFINLWLLLTGGIGLVVTLFTGSAAKSQLAMMGSMFGGTMDLFQNQPDVVGAVALGLGTWLAVVGYMGVAAGWFAVSRKGPSNAGDQVVSCGGDL